MPSDDVTDREGVDEYRRWLVQTHHTASQDFDKAVMTLSGGALGISLIFVRDYARDPSHKWTLAISWGALSVSLVLILFSFLASREALLRRIGEVDGGKPLPRFHTRATGVLTLSAGAGFVLGVLFLMIFVFLNV